MKPRACLIIDPFVSPKILSQALLDEKIVPIAIITDTWSDPQWKMDRMKEAYFEEIFECFTNRQITELAKKLKKYEVVACIYGREGKSIYKADFITHTLFPQFANPGQSSWRTDKFAMQEICRNYGLHTVRQLRIDSEHSLIAQTELITSLLPVVVKPSQASGSLGVAICNTLDEVTQAIKFLLGKKFATGIIDEVIIQKQLHGTEYFIDTVSLNQQHTICGIFRYKKVLFGNTWVYHWTESVDHQTKEAKSCIEYVTNVLDAVQMHHGLAHTELFLTNQGPCLVEINPRISGSSGFINKMAKYLYGMNQAECFAKALTSNKKLEPLAKPLNVHALILSLQNWKPRAIKNFNAALLQNFLSYREHIVLKKAGSYLDTPKSLHDTVAYVLLVNPSLEKLHQDAEKIFTLEENECLF